MEAKTAWIASRRQFLRQGSALAAAAALLGPAHLLAAEQKAAAEVGVTPTEDLMREHGVLRRIMLLFDDFGTRLQGAADFPLEALAKATKIIRTFIQDYHEQDEELQIFPSFAKAGKMMDLLKVLLAQHRAGRKVIAAVEAQATPDSLRSGRPRENQGVAGLLQPHVPAPRRLGRHGPLPRLPLGHQPQGI